MMVAAAFQIAGVPSLVLSYIVLVFGVWIFTSAEVWFSGWVKRTGLYRSSILAATCCLAGCLTLWLGGLITNYRLSQSPEETRTQTSGLSPSATEIAQDVIKGLRALPAPKPSTAFYVRPESEITSSGAPGRYTGFFVGHPFLNHYVLNPATEVVYVRITNLLPVKTMISRFESSLDRCPTTDQLDTSTTASVFIALPKNFPGKPAIGRILAIPDDGTGVYMVLDDLSEADLSRAARVQLPLLQLELSNRYLGPNETVGGWLLYSSKCMGGEHRFKIEDVAGRMFSYSVRNSNEMKTGDLVSREIKIDQAVDLSGAQVSMKPWGVNE
jgi:hypothetical protein